MTTFEKMMALMDATHKNFARQMEAKADAAGWDVSDVVQQRNGERMTDCLAILSLVGAELDDVKGRLANLEKYLENGATVN